MYELIGLVLTGVIAFFAYFGLIRSCKQIVLQWEKGGYSRLKAVTQVIGGVLLSIGFFILFDARNGSIFFYLIALGILFAMIEYFASEKDRLAFEESQRKRNEENRLRLASGESWTKDDVLEKFQTTIFFRTYGRLTTTQGWRCASCGKNLYRRDEASLDHIKPVSKHPELRFIESNLQILCRPCNSTKSAYLGDDWKSVTRSRRRVLKKKNKSEIERQRFQ